MFRWRHQVSTISGLMSRGFMSWGFMSTVAEPHTKGRDAACTASHPLAYVCTRGAVSMSSAAGLVLQVRDSFVSAHVLISHELLDAVSVHVHVYLAAQGANFGADTVGNFTLNAVAQI